MPRLHLCIIILDFIHLPILLFTDSFNYIKNNIIFIYNIFRTYSISTNKSDDLEIVNFFEVLMQSILKRWVNCSNMLRYLCLSLYLLLLLCKYLLPEETSWPLDFSSPRTITTYISTGTAPESLRNGGCTWYKQFNAWTSDWCARDLLN